MTLRAFQPGDHVHVAGVGGVGMSALARLLAGLGLEVTGSDRYLDQGRELPVFQQLRACGVQLVSQDGQGINRNTRAVAFSTAVEEGNPDFAAARRWEVPLVHRAKMLAQLAAGKRGIAIAGTAGKTTVTGMVGWLLEKAGLDPTVVNGGAILNWQTPRETGNVRLGASDWWVLETDESDRSLLEFSPEVALLTNISHDHFSLAEVIALFQRFARRVQKTLICGPGVESLMDPGKLSCRCFSPPGTCVIEEGGAGFDYQGQHFHVPLPGLHNAVNALLAVALCEKVGCGNLSLLAGALAEFKGIHRRLQTVGTAGNVRVIDDYAHNPEKIRAAWLAVAANSPRVVGIWRPHGFAPLAAMFEDFVQTFVEVCRPKDELFILPVYYAGGTTDKKIDAKMLYSRLHSSNIAVKYVDNYDILMSEALKSSKYGDSVLCMGARDPNIHEFALKLSSEIKKRNIS